MKPNMTCWGQQEFFSGFSSIKKIVLNIKFKGKHFHLERTLNIKESMSQIRILIKYKNSKKKSALKQYLKQTPRRSEDTVPASEKLK